MEWSTAEESNHELRQTPFCVVRNAQAIFRHAVPVEGAGRSLGGAHHHVRARAVPARVEDRRDHALRVAAADLAERLQARCLLCSVLLRRVLFVM